MSTIAREYPVSDWNIYAFHFSDGDNWSTNDNEKCQNILNEQLLPAVNLFGYGQVKSPYGSGQFIKDLHKAFGEEGNDKVITSEIKDREAIVDSIKTFLGKGR